MFAPIGIVPLGENETRVRFETGQHNSQKDCLTFDPLNLGVWGFV
jgi:hypothetical protein